MIRTIVPLTLICWIATLPSSRAAGDDTYQPGDPFAAIDGNPIYLGELNLILAERLNVRDMDRVSIDMKKATAALLVRRHLALKSLQQQGGRILDGIVKREIESLAHEATRRGSSLAKQAAANLGDEQSLIANLTWRVTWRRYLKSRLNETNLRRFFDREKTRYGGGRWEVSQIFVDMDASDEPSAAITAKRMTDLARQLSASDSVAIAFANAASEQSDAGSAGQDGMVGWVQHDGDLPASVMEVVRNIGAGKVSDPIRSPLGMHLIYVHKFQKGKLTFDKLADRSQLHRDATDALFESLVRSQADAKIVWFITALRPPPSISIIPKP